MAEHDINWPKKFVPSQVSFLTGIDNNFIGKKVYLPLCVIFYCPEKERTIMYFLNKKTKSAIHRWGFVWVYYYYKWGFGCFSAVRVHVWPSRWPCSEWSFWLVNFKVTISSQTLSLNQLLHVFWALTLKCLLSHMMLIQIPWPTQEVITSHINRQLHNLGRGRRSFKPYPKRALFSQTSQSKMQKITLDVDLKMALLLLE